MTKNSVLLVLVTSAVLSTWLSLSFHFLATDDNTTSSRRRHLSATVDNDARWKPSSPATRIGKHPHNNNENTTHHLLTTVNSSISGTDPSCLQRNSHQWLTGNRLSNAIIESNHYNEFLQKSILNTDRLFSLHHKEGSKHILEQTICHTESNFLNLDLINTESTGDDDDALSLQQLALRLLYLTIHVHQHQAALPEALHRSSIECQDELQQYQLLDRFDFECPTAQFLVVPMKDRGLGALMRNDVATVLLAGISTNRVVLFVNGSPVGPSYLQKQWSWSSCSRYDKQCFFLPDSPCVLTETDLQTATVLSKGERRQVFKTGLIPERAESARVVVMDMWTRPQRTPRNFRERVVQLMQHYFVQPLVVNGACPNDPRLLRLTQAMDFVLRDDEGVSTNSTSFGYFGRNSTAHHAMILYAMRPNHDHSAKLKAIMQDTFSGQDPSTVKLGLPIRASDKCGVESECPSFDVYMDLMKNVWRSNANSVLTETMKSPPDTAWGESVSILFTSESSQVHQERLDFEEASHHNLFFPAPTNSTSSTNIPFRFVTNSQDLVQDTGDPTKLNNSIDTSKEDILLSAIASLQLQLYSDYAVANCCSSHHLLMVDLLQEGCGRRHHGRISQCMQDHDDPQFRLCCAWTQTPECNQKKQQGKLT